MKTCEMIWNEFNEERIFKKFLKQCNQCFFLDGLLNDS
jgi:hypothetical protein